jgi:hypothetical protein
MKIIKSLLLLTVGFCVTTLLLAQEVKTDIAKPLEVKIPATGDNKTSPQPKQKQQAPADAVAVPSPYTRKAEPQPQVNEKPEAIPLNKNDIATPGGEEGKKIMAGKASKPTDTIYSPSTIDPKLIPPPVTKAAKSSQQQQ